MKALVVCLFILGVVAMLSPAPESSREETREQAVALNYIMFRTAVLEHMFHKPDTTGDIEQSVLALPDAWKPMRPWKARVTGGLCLVFGEAGAAEIVEVRRLLRWSRAVGTAQGGGLVPGYGVFVPAPGVPDGHLVSVIKL